MVLLTLALDGIIHSFSRLISMLSSHDTHWELIGRLADIELSSYLAGQSVKKQMISTKKNINRVIELFYIEWSRKDLGESDVLAEV